MGLQLVAGPTVEPVELGAIGAGGIKDYMRVDIDTDDTLITSLIPQARAYIESQTGLALITQTWRYSMDRFPGTEAFWQLNPGFWLANPLWNLQVVGQAFDPVWTMNEPLPYRRKDTIYIPKAPVQSIQSVTYLDENGQQQTLASTVYDIDVSTDPARIRLAQGQTWPEIYPDIGSVQVNFTAGYGADATAVPPDILRAVYMMVAYAYSSREAVISEYHVIPAELPHGVQAVIQGRQRPMLA